MDVLGANPEGASVIATIKHYTFTMPSGAAANITVNISEVDPAKAVPFFYGAGANDPIEGASSVVYPYLVELNPTTAIVKASMANVVSVGCGITVIEYI